MFRNLLVIALTLVAAGLACSDAAGRSLSRRLPQMAAELPLASGFVQSGAANIVLAKGLGAGLFETVDLSPADAREVGILSRSGYRKEPLNSEAVRNLALLASSQGERAEATRLMRIAAELTKRDLGTNIWLAGDYARLGDLETSLDMYDQGLRTSARAQELIIPAMIQRLEDPSLVEPLIRLLAKSPPWMLEFWGVAPHHPRAHESLGRIRLALAERRIPVGPVQDRILVQTLASSGNLAAATKLLNLLEPAQVSRTDAVRNAEFDHPPDYLPFDFQPLFDASLTSEIDDRAGTLRILVFGGGSGLAARQIVALPAPRYRLIAEAAEWEPAQRGLVYFKLACAEPGKAAETPPITLEAASLSVAVAKPLAGCVHHWLMIYAAPSPGEGASAVVLDRVSLVPTGG